MEKVKAEEGESADIIADNIESLKELFPDAFNEGGIDFDVLRQLLGDAKVLNEGEEKYGLNWHGKKKARQIALTPSTGTLIPCPEESINWDTTQNLFIEGDNLEVLKLLQKSYANRVKMIYIDPPYNTGREFIYPDKYQDNLDTYLKYTKQKSDEGFKLSSNTESSGRFHTNWLNMMYPRLKLAKNLLRNDGVIFISIDDNELSSLLQICKEIYGEDNYIGTISRATGTRMGTGSRGIARELDYVLVFSKTADYSLSRLPMSDEELSLYNQEDEKGKYLTRSLRRTGGENRREDRPSMFYPVISPDGTEVYPIAPEGWESRWVCGKDTYEQLVEDGFIEWKKVVKDGVERWQVYQKHYVTEGLKESSDLWTKEEGNKKATRDLNALFDGKKVFDHPKPLGMNKKLLQLGTESTSHHLVLDFFAGSCALGHAVFEQNALDNGNRRYIMVQLPEECEEKSNAFKSGFATISDLGKERLKRACGKIKSEYSGFKGDLGFKVFKLANSNIRVWSSGSEDLEATLLSNVDHLVENCSEQEVLYELLLKRGIDLSVPIENRDVGGKRIFSVGYGALFACLNESISKDQVEEIGQGIVKWHKELAPSSDTHVFFRDSAFSDDVSKTNMAAILEQNGINHVRSL